MIIKSRICDLLGIKYPIFQGGMAWVSEANLASAVSEAGGLGLISAMNANVDYVAAEIKKCRTMTDKPFGVNIMLMSPFADDIAQLVIDEKVPVVTTGAGMPSKYIGKWLEAGIKVIPVAASVAFALRMQSMGATAVVAEGAESGGHVGEMNTMPLVPQVCDALSIPVLAAGGIADGRGVAAAFMLGADGVQCGTRFLTATECKIHDNYKNKIVAAHDIDTIVTGKKLGHPVRSLKTVFSRKFSQMENNANVPSEEIEKFGTGALRKATQEGDSMGCYMAGEIAGLVNKIQPAKEIIEEMMQDACNLMLKAGDLVIK
ncbi:MAG: enoyl-[acyl-carrier-protein] reductase FabK [Bacteroidales bacterium]|nr:enoyl-[acyl-carrier-protein] reductase FabK [Bacteroidales bacterium]